MKNFILAFAATAALALAGTNNFKLTLFQPAVLNGTELKAGEYKAEISGDKLTLRNGKTVAEASVRVETTGGKFGATTVKYANGDGKYRITEIRVGGTGSTITVAN